jgi:hypothetical protein
MLSSHIDSSNKRGERIPACRRCASDSASFSWLCHVDLLNDRTKPSASSAKCPVRRVYAGFRARLWLRSALWCKAAAPNSEVENIKKNARKHPWVNNRYAGTKRSQGFAARHFKYSRLPKPLALAYNSTQGTVA